MKWDGRNQSDDLLNLSVKVAKERPIWQVTSFYFIPAIIPPFLERKWTNLEPQNACIRHIPSSCERFPRLLRKYSIAPAQPGWHRQELTSVSFLWTGARDERTVRFYHVCEIRFVFTRGGYITKRTDFQSIPVKPYATTRWNSSKISAF